jgi:hypothetical protein
MQTLPCPSCGADLDFRSAQSVFRVCPYCQSTIVRQDLNLEDMGKMAELAEDLSPIQIGTTGRYRSLFFYVSGRIIYKWKDGIWNEWHLYFDNGETGWLSEAQGEFAISRPMETRFSPDESDLSLGKVFNIKKDSFRLSDIKDITYQGSEGELPFKAFSDYRATVYDFSHEGAKFLTLEFPFDKDIPSLAYMGEYVDFMRLEPQNIRLIEGWGL